MHDTCGFVIPLNCSFIDIRIIKSFHVIDLMFVIHLYVQSHLLCNVLLFEKMHIHYKKEELIDIFFSYVRDIQVGTISAIKQMEEIHLIDVNKILDSTRRGKGQFVVPMLYRCCVKWILCIKKESN